MWYIGQEIVVIETHPYGYFKKGDEFTIKEIRQGCCSLEFYIGLPTNAEYSLCKTCLNRTEKTNGRAWFSENRFAPKITLSNMTYNDAIELVSKTVKHEQ